MTNDTEVLLSTLKQWSDVQLRRVQNTVLQGALVPMPGDASARKYYRICSQENKNYIVVHAPPQYEKNREFIAIAQSWLEQGIRTPVVFAADIKLGFLLLEDLGKNTLLTVLQQKSNEAASHYQHALSTLYRIQAINPSSQNTGLACYDAVFMRQEMNLFNEWVAGGLLGPSIGAFQKKIINTVFEDVIMCVAQQPYVVMHRDYHSKNLMSMCDGIGVLDFQDAVIGPVLYDVVSLLRDCYIDWPQTQVYAWLDEFVPHCPSIKKMTKNVYYRWFDWMGLQRHLKVAGLFMRKWIRDGNTFYLKDLPRVFSYITYVGRRYSALTPLNEWIEEVVIPVLSEQPWWEQHVLRE